MGKRNEQSMGQRGVAIIAVLAALAILGGAVAEFSTDTAVDGVSASNARDEMLTHFLTRSGANLTQLIIKVQTDVVDKYRQQLGDFQIADYAGMFMGAFGGRPDERDAIAAMLGGFKADAIKGLGVEVGGFDVAITTDDGRININCANGSQQTQETLKAQLEALFYFEAFDPIFESEDAEGWRRDRATQAAALIDYIDRDRVAFGQGPGAAEEYGYETLDDRYRAKNNYIDTVGELKLVRGMDDRMWTLFGDQFTAYGDCKVNIGAVQDPKLIASIIFLSAKNPDDPVVKDPLKLWALARMVIEARSWGVYFDDLQSFADFVKDPQGSLGTLFSTPQADGTTPQPGQTPDLGGVQVEGVELDATKLGQVARSGPRRIYRVEVVATVPRGVEGTGNDYVKRLVAVWDTKTQNQNNRDQSSAKGAWIYWREE
jgi:type II secretory pathway component PulK